MTSVVRYHYPELTFELQDDNDDSGLILLSQIDYCSNEARILIHPEHVKAIAEKFGLAPTTDPEASKTIRRLQKQLRNLQERIDHLADYLCNHSDHRHADLQYETNFANATSDIAESYVDAFDDGEQAMHVTPPKSNAKGNAQVTQEVTQRHSHRGDHED